MNDAKDLISRIMNDRQFTINDSHRYWLLVTHPANFEVMKAKNIAAMKAKRKSFADRVKRGDKVVFYLTKIGKFGGAAEFTSKVREDKSEIFPEESGKHSRSVAKAKTGSHSGSEDKASETHPWRFDVKFEVALDEKNYVPAENFKDKLKYLKKWPAKYWKLGFQGNVHEIPKEDYELLKAAL